MTGQYVLTEGNSEKQYIFKSITNQFEEDTDNHTKSILWTQINAD